jgi:hypothetical protein
MALVPGWIYPLTIFAFGTVAFSLMVIAENAKPQQDSAYYPSNIHATIDANGVRTCHYPKDNSPTLSAIAVAFMFTCAVLANVFSRVPFAFGQLNVFVPFHRILVYVWYCLAWSSTIVPIIIGSYAAWQEATHHRNASQNIYTAYDYYGDDHILCPTVKTGIFAGMGFIMAGSTVQWTAFYVMTQTARFQLQEEEAGYKGAYVGSQAAPVEAQPVAQ